MRKTGSSWTSVPTLATSRTWEPSPPTAPPPRIRLPKAIVPTTAVPKAAATAVQRRLFPPTGLSLADLHDYSDDEIDVEC